MKYKIWIENSNKYMKSDGEDIVYNRRNDAEDFIKAIQQCVKGKLIIKEA